MVVVMMVRERAVVLVNGKTFFLSLEGEILTCHAHYHSDSMILGALLKPFRYLTLFTHDPLLGPWDTF